METSFPSLADIDLQWQLLGERATRHSPLLAYTPLDKDLSIYDEVHDEVISSERVYKPTVSLRAHVVPAEQAFPLTVFGIEELRDAVLQVAVPSLVEAGLAAVDETTRAVTLLAATGDRFTLTGFVYEVLVWKIGQTFGSTDVPLFFLASCEKVRRDASPYEGL